ncbi:MAG: hypothetical protein ABWZ16_08565 [Microbacterium sp.]
MSPHPERRPARRNGIALGCVGAGIALALAACSSTEPAVSPRPSTTTTATAEASPSPAATADAVPTLVPAGTAEDNLPVFTTVTAAVWATPEQVSGRAYIDALVAAGFDRSAMQVTYDQSTVGNPAESIQFSVRWGEECLIGQVGPATGAPVTVLVPVLGEGNCLVGDTRPIDW